MEKQGERATYWQRGEMKIRFVKVKLPGLYSKALEKGWSLLFGFFYNLLPPKNME